MENEKDTKVAEIATETPEIVENTENQVAENCESAEESCESTESAEQSKENEQKTAKVEPLPEQKPFLMSPYERAIHEEMERRATDNPALAEGLKDKDKSIQECYAFVANRAKKMADGNCAMIADNEVYNWAQFYYTQRREIIELEYERPKKPTYTPPTKPATITKTEKKADKKKDTTKAEQKKAEPKTETKSAEKTEEKTEGKVYNIAEELSLF